MTRWYQHRFHTVGLLEFMFWGMGYFPRFMHPPLAAMTSLIFCLLLTRERRAVTANLRQITGFRGLALAWKVYRVFFCFSDAMVSYCYVPQATHQQLGEMLEPDDEHADHTTTAAIADYLAAGKGLIVWTAHLGNPEFASRLLERHGRPVNIARVVEDQPAEKFLREKMANDCIRVINLRAGAAATIELLQALRRNEIVAIQGDRVYNPRHSVTVPFFSKPAAFPLGPFLLSQVSGAPLLPAFVIRRRWLRYSILSGQAIFPNPSSDRKSDPEAAQRAALATAVRFLESQLAVHYDQWTNFFDFWRVNVPE